MTTIIPKEIGSKSNIKFKGLGDPGPFSFALTAGAVPTGTVLNTSTGELKGNFDKIEEAKFTLKGKKKDRIEGTEEFIIKVSDWQFTKNNFTDLVDDNGLTWLEAGGITRIANDTDLLDGICYEFNNGGLKMSLPEEIGNKDFEMTIVFKPNNNGGPNSYARLIQSGPSNTSGILVITKDQNTTPIALRADTHTTQYDNLFIINNSVNGIVTGQWNHLIFSRKANFYKVYINYNLVASGILSYNLRHKDIYLFRNSLDPDNSERFHGRLKLFDLRVNENRNWSKPNIVTDIWRIKFKERVKILLKSNESVNYNFTVDWPAPFLVRLKDGQFLPTGLTLRSNRIQGTSELLDNLEVTFELVISGVVHDEVKLTIFDISKPNHAFILPLIGDVGSNVFGDTASRNWTKDNDVRVVEDKDNLLNGVSTYFNGSSQRLYLSDPTFILGLEDFCYSFWTRPFGDGRGNANRRYIQHGSPNQQGSFTLFSSETTGKPLIQLAIWSGSSWYYPFTPIDMVNLNYNHIALSRKNHEWRLFINGSRVAKFDFNINIVSDTVYIGSNESLSENIRANFFNIKLSKYTIDHWDSFIPPLITKWGLNTFTLVEAIGSVINKVFKSDYPHTGVTFKVKDTSALPLGLSLSNDGKLTGTITNIEKGESVIECYINDVLNNTVIMPFETMVDIRDYFLTHHFKSNITSTGIGIYKNKDSINVNPVNVVLTDDGPMVAMLTRSPRQGHSPPSTPPIRFAANDPSLSGKAFCIEADLLISAPIPVVGQGITHTLSQPLFSTNGYYGYAFAFNLYGSKIQFTISYEGGDTNIGLATEIDINVKNHVVFSCDLSVLRVYLNGKLVGQIPYNGWTTSSANIVVGMSTMTNWWSRYRVYSGFIDNVKIYQGSPIYSTNFVPLISDNGYKADYPIIEPNKPYKGRISGIRNQTVSITRGTLPDGLVIDSSGLITGTTSITKGTFPITLNVVNGLLIDQININLSIANYILDLDFSNPITNTSITDKCGNEFTVVGAPVINNNDTSFTSGKSMAFNGIDTYLRLPFENSWKLKNSDWVLEFELKLAVDAKPNDGNRFGIISQRSTGTSQHSYSVEISTGYGPSSNDSNLLPLATSIKNSVGMSLSNTGSEDASSSVQCFGYFLEIDKVYSIKFRKDNNLLRLYINGKLITGNAIPLGYSLFQSSQDILIGCLDNLTTTNRVLNGSLGHIKLYTTSDFDFLDLSIGKDNIVSWLNIPESTTEKILDYNTINTWTQGTNGVTVSNGEIIFNGSSNLQTAPNENWNFGNLDFTMEFEVLFDSTATSEYQGLLSKRINSSSRCSFSSMFANDSWHENNQKFEFNANSSGAETTGIIARVASPITRDQYIKISITRAYKKIYFHINGNLVSATDSNESLIYWDTVAPILLGVLNNEPKTSRYLKGKLRHMRVFRGIALYNSAQYTDFKDIPNPFIDGVFTPNRLSTRPVIYLESETSVANETGVIQSWLDSNNNHDFTSLDPARRPKVSGSSLNNFKTIRFNGNEVLYNNSKTVNSIYRKTSFIWSLVVFKKNAVDTTGVERVLLSSQTNSSGWERYGVRVNYTGMINKLAHSIRTYETSGAWTPNINTTDLGTDWVIGLSMVDLANRKSYVYVNGISQVFTLDVDTTTPDTDSADVIAIGNYSNGRDNLGFDGSLALLISGNRSISLDEADKLIGWAAHKYALTNVLPDEHPYKKLPPTVQTENDVHYDNVEAFLTFDGDFTDRTGRTWNTTGTPVISAERLLFNKNSLKISGLDSDVSTPNLIETGECFTVDLWFYINGDAGGQYNHCLIGQGTNIGAGDQSLNIPFLSNGKRVVVFDRQVNAPYPITLVGTSTVPENSWNHIELSYDGVNIRCFLNGKLEFIGANAVGWLSTSWPFTIGRHSMPGYMQWRTALQGHIKYFRYTKGIVRHKTNFTPMNSPESYSKGLTVNKTFRERALELQPIGYWPLDEKSGTKANDISGYNFHGDLVWGTPEYNGPRLKKGSSRSMGFNSGVSCLQVPIAQAGTLISGLNDTGREFTIIYLYQKTSSGTQGRGITGYTSPSGGNGAFRVFDYKNLDAVGGSVYLPAVDINSVQFVAWKKDFKQGKFKAYTDGTWFVGTDNISKNTTGAIFNHPLMIPGSGDASYGHYPALGYYSDVMIFNKALSDKQIEELYTLLNKPPYIKDVEEIIESNVKLSITGNSLTKDSSINSLTLVPNGAVSIIPSGGKNSDAIKFDAGSSLVINSPDIINLSDKSFALEFDLKPNGPFGVASGTEQWCILTNITAATGLTYEWFFGITEDGFKFSYGVRGIAYMEVLLYWPESVKLIPNNTYTIAVQKNADNELHCYLNGVRGTKYKLRPYGNNLPYEADVTGSFILNVNLGNIGTPIRIGNFLDNYQIHGEISDLKLLIGQHLYNNNTYKINTIARAAYRHYKMVINASSSGSNGWTELQEMELASVRYGSDITTPATPVTASSHYESGKEIMRPSGLVDNDLLDPDKASWAPSSSTYPAWVSFDLGVPHRLDEIRIMSRNKTNYSERGPGNFDIQGSNNTTTWTSISNFTTAVPYKLAKFKKFSIAPVKYRYYKLILIETEAGGDYFGLSRVVLASTFNGAVYTVPSNTIITASSTYTLQPYDVKKLIKTTVPSDVEDGWVPATQNSIETITFDLKTQVSIEELKILPQLNYASRSPKRFKLIGSNDLISWDTIREVNTATGWVSGVWKSFHLTQFDSE